MMRFSFGSFLLAACLAFAVPAEARDFRVAETQVPDYPTVEGVKHMDKLLRERTDGRLGLKVYPNSALGQERDTIEQLKIGGVDMIRLSAAPLNNIVPETIVVSLPYIFRSFEHMHTVLDGPIGDEILKSMEEQGIVGLAWYDDGARSIYTKSKPIKTLADLQGMKLRVQQSDLFVAMVEALGASATPLPYGEVYTALTTGIIDAAENSIISYETARHFEAAPYYNLTEHTLLPSVLVFSKPIWDRLPEEDQALIRQAAEDSVPYMRGLLDSRITKAKETVQAGGAQFIPIENKQAFVDAVQPLYEQFAGTPELKSLAERIQATK